MRIVHRVEKMTQRRFHHESEDKLTALIAGEERDKGSREPALFGILFPDVHVSKLHSDITLNLYCVFLLMVVSTTGFANVALTKIVEDVICYRHYNHSYSFEGPIDEKLCKSEAIQSKVAMIFAISGMCEGIVALVAVFHGALLQIGRSMTSIVVKGIPL